MMKPLIRAMILAFAAVGTAAAQIPPPPPPPPPGALPTTKEQCFKDGWKKFGVFKNQGDCVSFVATKGKNPPALVPPPPPPPPK